MDHHVLNTVAVGILPVCVPCIVGFRPINWANRPKSYVMRTEDWDEFPNGRWGDSSSPAFGELSDLSHFYQFSLGNEEDRRAMLGVEPKTPQDIFEVFARYVEGKIPHIPWCETPLQPESLIIQNQLAELNRQGFLTINSQVSAQSNTISFYGICGSHSLHSEFFLFLHAASSKWQVELGQDLWLGWSRRLCISERVLRMLL